MSCCLIQEKGCWLKQSCFYLAGWFLLRRGHTNKNKQTKLFFFCSSYCCADGALKMNVEWKAKNTAMVLYLCFMHAVCSKRMPNNTNLRLSFIFLVETRNTYTYLLCVFVFLIRTYLLCTICGTYSAAYTIQHIHICMCVHSTKYYAFYNIQNGVSIVIIFNS